MNHLKRHTRIRIASDSEYSQEEWDRAYDAMSQAMQQMAARPSTNRLEEIYNRLYGTAAHQK